MDRGMWDFNKVKLMLSIDGWKFDIYSFGGGAK